jgi:hypothetical protein
MQSPRASAVGTVAPAGFREYFERSRDQPVYVILGVQGSGTNLLGRLLTRIFNFSVMRDRSMVFNAAARLRRTPTKEDVQRAIQTFERIVAPSVLRRKMTRKVLKKGKPLAGVTAELRRWDIRSGAEFARLIYAYRAFSLGAASIGIKSDDLWESLHHLDEVIPNRRIILLTRDFRDNLLSISGKGFGPIEPLCAARYVKNQLSYYAAEYRRAGSSGYHVRFETLVNDTRRFIEDFARHFQLEPAVNPDTAIKTLRFRPNKIGKWQRLSPRELAWCEGILREELLEFGYPLASGSPAMPGAGRLMAATARDVLRRVPQKIRQIVGRLER